ncbi:MAG TPA: hypothetical protein VMU98_00845 [Acidimicrobiales bacterium]|nr:hypothetical protein [Acidimicrobiales bacterium]
MASEHWKTEPEDHDYAAAEHYLSLIFSLADATALVSKLRAASLETFAAKDLLRASGLELLTRDNAHVHHDLDKVKNGEKLSPVLLVRGDATRGIPLAIADGYHRVCASYWIDENTLIPARIVASP